MPILTDLKPSAPWREIKTTPDVDAKALRLWVAANSFSENLLVDAVVTDAGREVARVTGLANSELFVNLPNARLWSPDDPFLYDLKVTLRSGSRFRPPLQLRL